MKCLSALFLSVLLAVAHGHTIFQRVSVNGADQGSLKGLRAPDSNNPIQNVNDADFACNKGLNHKDSSIITIPAGAQVGAFWGHVIGGAQIPNDPDNPIAASHKGPVMVYLAKVSNAASTGTTGLQRFKISQDGLDSSGKWGVDRLISNKGWAYFTLPQCIAPGNYLMRVEIIALHSASSQGGAQFYMECAQINVTGSGTNSGSNFVSFPGAYKANDPGIQLSIYDTNSQPNNGGRPYTIPGPAVLSCAGSGGGSPSQVPPPPPPPTTYPAPTATPPSTGGAPLYGQCGGTGWTGATTCSQGTCKVSNEWYSQCLP